MQKNCFADTGNTLLGHSGLIVVPSGYIAQDGELCFGYGRVHRLNATEYKAYERNVKFARLSFLPFLEGTFSIVRPDDYPGGIGDRTVGVKLNIFKENSYMPALSIGIHDFIGIKKLKLEPERAQHFAATYMVGSKMFKLPYIDKLAIHAGYGEDWLPARTYQLVGLFGGIEIYISRHISAMIEYDADTVNFGSRMKLWHFQLLLAWWDARKFSWNISYSFMLNSL